MSERGKLIILSGPSGAGKSTVVSRAMQDRDDLCFSTSVTTRAPREGEVHGKDYFFIDQKCFDEMVARDELLEYATYVSNSYGTPRTYVEEQLDAGMNVILDIEIQGVNFFSLNDSSLEELVHTLLIPAVKAAVPVIAAAPAESVAALMNWAEQTGLLGE